MEKYKYYIDGIELPVTPGKITVTPSNRNETIELANNTVVSHMRPDGLESYEFEMLVPLMPFGSVDPDVLQSPDYYIGKFEEYKKNKKSFQFIITRTNSYTAATNVAVTLEGYDQVEDAEDGGDVTITVKLKRYAQWHNMQTDVSLNHHLIISKYARGWRT